MGKLYFYIFVSFIFSLPLRSEDCVNCLPKLSGVPSFDKSANELSKILRQFQIQTAKNNPAKFCKDNLRQRLFNVNKKKFLDNGVREIDDPKFDQVADKIVALGGQWYASLIPSEKVRRSAVILTCAYGNSNMGTSVPDYLSTPRPRSANDINKAAQLIKKISDGNLKSENILKTKTVQAVKTMACAQLTLFKAGECTRGIDIIEDTMMPSIEDGASSISGVMWWQQIYKSNKYEEGLRLVAKKLIDFAYDRGKLNIAPDANIFDDLKNSFISTNLSSKEAEDAAFVVLGAISTGGANTWSRTNRMDKNTSQLSQSLNVIAVAMNHLDSLKQDRGYPLYSYPKGVKNSCDTGKPYHFWMSAALSRKLVIENKIEPKSAAAATYIAAKAYQVHRNVTNTGLGNNLSSILQKDAHDPVSEIIRADLAYSSSGAIFGAACGKNKCAQAKISIDEAIVDLMNASPGRPGLSKEESINVTKGNPPIEAYKRWDDTFKPNDAFKDNFKVNKDLLN